MSETPTEPTAHAWLDPELVAAWLQLDLDAALPAAVESCRRAAAAYCVRQRPDLFPIDPLTMARTFAGDDDTVQAGLLATARIYARRSSPAGLADYGEFGAAAVLRLDPDVARLLGTGRHAPPRVG